MKKDVLFLCQFFYPETVSSATLPFDTAASLCKQGFSVGACLLLGFEASINVDLAAWNANVAYFDRISLVYDESRATSYDYAGENIATITLPDGKRVEYIYTDGNAPHSPSTVTATKRRSPRSFSLPPSPPLRRRQARSGISTAKSSLSHLRKTHKTQEWLSIGAVRL